MDEAGKPLVSIIVPVYKVEKYLQRCLDSIAAQTYQNIEVILVDDGSPDNCGEICEAFAKTNTYTKVIHQKNQGLSAARNNAVPESHGEYITFVDSDDYITPDYVEYLVSLCESFDAEVSVGSFVFQYDNKESAVPREESRRMFLSPEEALRNMNYGIGFGVTAWGKLYKRALVEANPYPVGKLYEDIATTYKIVGESTGVAFGNKQIYFWIQRRDSIMHSSFNRRQLDGMDAAEEQLKYIEEHFPDAVPAAKYRFTAKAIELMAVAFSSGGDREIYAELKAYMNRFADEVLKDPYAKRTMKMRILAMKMGRYPAKLAFGIHEGLKWKKV